MVDSALWLVLAYTGAAGLAIPAGALASHWEHLGRGRLRTDLLLGIVAFGGGALLAAVALVLVPEGARALAVGGAAAAFAAGAVVFLVIDRAIERRGSRAAQLMAMIMDFVPESVALGAAVALGGGAGPLLALLIGMQNLPEGFNAYRELRASKVSAGRALGALAPLAVLGPLAGMIGFFWLDAQPVLLGVVMLFAAGGILYLLFHDVMPVAHEEGHWLPTLGGIAGFLMGLVGEMVLRGG